MEESPFKQDKSSIELLPGEVLLKILRFLPLDDIKNAFLVCKIFNFTLNDNIYYIPKYNISRYKIEEKENELKVEMQRNSYDVSKKIWFCVMKLKTNDDENSEETFDVADFYRNKGLTGLKWGAGHKAIEFAIKDLNETLEEHLSFVCKKVNFNSLVLENVSTENTTIIKNVLKKCNTKISHLKFVVHDSLKKGQINFMKEIKFDCLYILRHIGANVDILFENMETPMRNICILAKEGAEKDVIKLNDEQLLMLEGEFIDVYAKTLITPKGIRKLINDYCNGTRDLQGAKFGLLPKEIADISTKRTYIKEWFVMDFGETPEEVESEIRWTIEGEKSCTISYNLDDDFVTIFVPDDDEE